MNLFQTEYNVYTKHLYYVHAVFWTEKIKRQGCHRSAYR